VGRGTLVRWRIRSANCLVNRDSSGYVKNLNDKLNVLKLRHHDLLYMPQ
jgi:hypothetical protein